MAEKLQTNLRVLKRTRKKPQVGDIFTFQLEPIPNRFFFGRVIKTDTKIGNIENVILIYIYKSTSSEKFQIPELTLDDLMLAPLGVSNLLWTDGYFETVDSKEIKSEELLPKHCFKSLSKKDYFYDEYGNRLIKSFEPCGDWAMGWHLAVDRAVSKFMGIPLVS